MSDDWARPNAGEHLPPAPADDVIEITLDGPEGFQAPSQPGDLSLDHPVEEPSPQEPNWRKIVGISSVVGIVVGLIVAIALLGGDDDPGEVDPATTTLAPDDASTLITTPPTLPPVDEFTGEFAGEDADEDSPGPVSVPSYPSVLAETWGAAASDFPLELPSLPIERPVITLVEISRAADRFGGPAVYDPVTDRFQIALGDGAEEQILLMDLTTEEILIAFGPVDEVPERWNRVPREIFGPAGELDLRDYMTALLLGPLRADNISLATSIDGDQLVLLDPETAARRRDVVMPAGSIAEWDALYGNGDDVATSGELAFELYISQDRATYITQGVNNTGSELIATVHRVRIGDDRVAIDWPDDDLIDDFDPTPPTTPTTPTDVTLDELRPVYEPAEDALADPSEFDLPAAVEGLRRRPPAAYTVWERGPRGVYEISIRRDDANDRLAYTRQVVETRDGLEPPFDPYFAQIDDLATDTGWLRRAPDDGWASGPLGAGIAPIDPRWAVGLVTADALSAAHVIGRAATPVVLDNGVVAMPFTLLIPADTLQWDTSLVGGIAVTSEIEVQVFVGADGVIHEIQVTANAGLPRLYQQRFDQTERTVTVDLP